MNVTRFRLSPHHLKELRNPRALFIVDFRAISNQLSDASTWAFYYENMLLPFVEEGFVVINQNALPELIKASTAHLVTIPATTKISSSVAQRIYKNIDWANIDAIWAAVPHPDIDRLARDNNKPLNYSYAQFSRYNDKILQKKTVPQELTPEWSEEDGVMIAPKDCYLKKRLGSGGLEVWSSAQTHNYDGQEYAALMKEDPSNWYCEKEIKGTVCSAAFYTRGEDVIMYGWSEQIFAEQAVTSCIGGKLHDPESINEVAFKGLCECVDALYKELFEAYQGVWGIDFILEEGTGKFYFLETNVRLTTLTIPHLLLGKLGKNEGIYSEDIENVGEGSAINFDPLTNTYDVLRVK
jgi:hypothetical protein